MGLTFDPGPVDGAFADLASSPPGPDAYPYDDFRFEWGPVFHRGRLDGTARVLVLGQDPAQHECVARRAMVGNAGRRVQGFLARLGITRSYLVLNAFLYCVAHQGATDIHRDSAAIRDDRDAWLAATFAARRPDAVVAFGRAAEHAYLGFLARSGTAPVPFEEVPHPTSPRPGFGLTLEQATAVMLGKWSDAIERLAPHIGVPDEPPPADPRYGNAFTADDLPPIPAFDLPAGMPAWMTGLETWAERGDSLTEAPRRARIVVTVPAIARGWE